MPSATNGIGLLLSLCLMTSAGCGGPATDQQPVSGEVTLDGQRLDTGTVIFTPVQAGRSAGGDIVEGEFSIVRADGPDPGAYQVSISSRVPSGRRIENPNSPGDFTDELRQIVPARYNTRTELTVEVKRDSENHFKFPLESGAD